MGKPRNFVRQHRQDRAARTVIAEGSYFTVTPPIGKATKPETKAALRALAEAAFKRMKKL